MQGMVAGGTPPGADRDRATAGFVQRVNAKEDFVFACRFLAAVAGEGGVE